MNLILLYLLPSVKTRLFNRRDKASGPRLAALITLLPIITIMLGLTATANGATVTQLTTNSFDDQNSRVSGNNIVWQGWDGNDWEIFFFNGIGSTQLTANAYNDVNPQISGNNIVWQGRNSVDYNIFFYNGTNIAQLTNNFYDDDSPQISGGNIVWRSWDATDLNWEIFLYNGLVKQLTDNIFEDKSPQISGGNVTWYGSDGVDDEIFFFNGSVTTTLTANNDPDFGPRISGDNIVWTGGAAPFDKLFYYNGSVISELTYPSIIYHHYPQISGDKIVWRGWEGLDEEILFFNGTTVSKLTNNSNELHDDLQPQISGDKIVWRGWDTANSNYEILFYDGAATKRLTNNSFEESIPVISGNNVVWNGFDGTDWEIYSYEGTTTPTTVLSTSPTAPNGDNGWYKLIPTVTLTPDETATTYYSWDSTSTFSTYTVPFTASVGIHNLYYYSIDSSNTTEAFRSRIFKVDGAPPANPLTAIETNGVLNNGTVKGVDLNFTFIGATDSPSGVAGYNVYFGTNPNGTSVSFQASAAFNPPPVAPGTYYLRVQTRDNAGNTAGWQTLFTIKYEAPIFSPPIARWDSGPGNWEAAGNKMATGDFNGDGLADIVTLYGYQTERRTRAWVWLNNGAGGFNAPSVWWDSGVGNWDWDGTKLEVGDFDGDLVDDLVAFYGYKTERQTKAWVFTSNGATFDLPATWWDSGPNNWDWDGTKLQVGDFDGGGGDDIAAFYGYAGDQVRIFTFTANTNNFNSPSIWWDSGPGSWNWTATTIFASDFIGGNTVDELIGFYGYPGARSAIFLFE